MIKNPKKITTNNLTNKNKKLKYYCDQGIFPLLKKEINVRKETSLQRHKKKKTQANPTYKKKSNTGKEKEK